MKKWPNPCKFCTFWFLTYSPSCYGKFCNLLSKPMWEIMTIALAPTKKVKRLLNDVSPTHIVWYHAISWWRHQMETFSALLALCAGNSPITREFPSQRPVTRSFDAFLDHSWDWWLGTPSRSLWRHRTDESWWNIIQQPLHSLGLYTRVGETLFNSCSTLLAGIWELVKHFSTAASLLWQVFES